MSLSNLSLYPNIIFFRLNDLKNVISILYFFLLKHQFGMRKWKSHLTSRPLTSRSEIVRDLYADMDEIKDVKGMEVFVLFRYCLLTMNEVKV